MLLPSNHTAGNVYTVNPIEAQPLAEVAKSAVGPRPQPNDPLHGMTLEAIMIELVGHYGWPELGARIRVNSFNFDPSIGSSLKFLRKTPWARKKVETLFLSMRRNQTSDELDVELNVVLNDELGVEKTEVQ